MLTLSSAAYEIIKRAFLDNLGEIHPGKMHVTTKEDENKAVIQHTIVIYKEQAKENKLYTINMYHTTSKILTNGSNPNLCVENITKVLSDIDNDEIQLLNDEIREKCSTAGTQQPSTYHKTEPVPINNSTSTKASIPNTHSSTAVATKKEWTATTNQQMTT